MKKHLSVFGLFGLNSLYKILTVCGLLCIAEVGLIAFQFSKLIESESGFRFDYCIDASNIDICLFAAFLIITVILCITGTEYSSKVGYTLKRLSISENAVFVHQALYNGLTYIFLWAVQLLLIYVFGLYYLNTVSPDFTSNQSIFLSSYRSLFFHSILPLSDVLLLIRNLILAVALGFCTAVFTFKQRRKLFDFSVPFLVIYVGLFFVTDIGEIGNRIATIIISLILSIIASVTVFSTKEGYDE